MAFNKIDMDKIREEDEEESKYDDYRTSHNKGWASEYNNKEYFIEEDEEEEFDTQRKTATTAYPPQHDILDPCFSPAPGQAGPNEWHDQQGPTAYDKVPSFVKQDSNVTTNAIIVDQVEQERVLSANRVSSARVGSAGSVNAAPSVDQNEQQVNSRVASGVSRPTTSRVPSAAPAALADQSEQVNSRATTGVNRPTTSRVPSAAPTPVVEQQNEQSQQASSRVTTGVSRLTTARVASAAPAAEQQNEQPQQQQVINRVTTSVNRASSVRVDSQQQREEVDRAGSAVKRSAVPSAVESNSQVQSKEQPRASSIQPQEPSQESVELGDAPAPTKSRPRFAKVTFSSKYIFFICIKLEYL
jgi:hypothetical protein